MIVQLREPEKIPEPVNVMPSFMKWMPGSQPKAMMPGEGPISTARPRREPHKNGG